MTISLEDLRLKIENRIQNEPENPNPVINKQEALEIYHYDVNQLLEIAGLLRKYYFQNYVLVHILNNIRNGNCSEDCGYCAQKSDGKEIPIYTTKTEEEILEEAHLAKQNGAYRYCLVTSGRGINKSSAEKYAKVIKKIIQDLDLKVCLSAGLIVNQETAKILKEAGLDRYNHNLNTSRKFYSQITKTHSYEDRENTLKYLSKEKIGLCSGVIVGMGETLEDITDVAFELNRFGVESIPVNFFLPVPGNSIQNPVPLTEEKCLKILSLFRLINPKSEIRMAAGRELYLKDRQADGLKVSNSLFVSGYLNVKGSAASETIKMIYDSGYQLHPKTEKNILELKNAVLHNSDTEQTKRKENFSNVELKTIEELRPFYKK